MKFSERIGKTKPKSIVQLESMDDDLRHSLWNLLNLAIPELFDYISPRRPGTRNQGLWETQKKYKQRLLESIWCDFFKRPLNEIAQNSMMMGQGHVDPDSHIREYFMGCQWFEVYDFVEFMYKIVEDRSKGKLRDACNGVLQRELSGYRLIDGKFVPISDEVEVQEVEDALACSDQYEPASRHMRRALELYSDREAPDYPNAAKEAISAVEAMCQIIAEMPKKTLSEALKALENKGGFQFHGAFKKALDKLYAYAGDGDGIRHATLDIDTLGQEDVRFFIVVCSAFVNYLKEKHSKTA